jgi:hypothetical protein
MVNLNYILRYLKIKTFWASDHAMLKGTIELTNNNIISKADKDVKIYKPEKIEYLQILTIILYSSMVIKLKCFLIGNKLSFI